MPPSGPTDGVHLSQTSVFLTQGLTRNYRKKVTLLPQNLDNQKLAIFDYDRQK